MGWVGAAAAPPQPRRSLLLAMSSVDLEEERGLLSIRLCIRHFI